MKSDMTAEERAELEEILSRPVALPEGELETRPYDYRKRVLDKERAKILKRHGSAGGNFAADDGGDDITEEEALYHNHGGRNPLFMTLKEGDRRKVLLRDDHLAGMMRCRFVDDRNNGSNVNSPSRRRGCCKSDGADGCEPDEEEPLDPTDSATTQHIQHDLETLRIRRNDPANLGCSCRKLHVFLPGATDKSHHKKRGSHRRLPERKVREELRKRGLLNKGNEGMSRDKMEILLHDAIEKEPCCWGKDCVCARNGIECQADTCSCWHASHDVAHGGGASSSASSSGEAVAGKGGGHDVEGMKARCGNENGLYVVNLEGIARYREKYIVAKEDGLATSAN